MLRLRMAHKLWLAVAAIVVALVGVVGLSGYRSAQVQARSEVVTQEMQARVQAGLHRILDNADNTQKIAVFTSGGTITALLHLITQMPARQAFELNWQIVNTSLNQLKFRGREVALASFNSHAHLQLLKAPELITFR